ncbi:integrase core domain-containing protein [Kutzneria sp. NPDC051319]|uniref:integrase core domain-containing protein n=1 Tax=Kutzneria sp. NPDC051319 TaxID=3155047 RepID=UPI0034187E1F
MGCIGRWARPGSVVTTGPAESIWSTFKHEEYFRRVYATKAELVAAVDNWVTFYSSVRRHSAIGCSVPTLTRRHCQRLPEL